MKIGQRRPLKPLSFAVTCSVLLNSPAGATVSQEPSEWVVSIEHLRGSVHLITGRSAEGRVNLVASIGPDGVFLSDTGTGSMSVGIEEVLSETTGGTPDVKHVVNTHYHGDHTGGNPAVGAGASIAAHPATVTSLESGARAGPAPLTASAMPTVLIGDSVTVQLNGEDVRIVHIPQAHTDGDLAVHFLGADVLHVGDIVLEEGSLPYTRFPHDFADAAAALADRAGPNTIVVPGHGDPLDRNGLVELADIVRETVAHVDRQRAAGHSSAGPSSDWPPEWRSWDSRYLSMEAWLERLFEDASGGP